jgi:hypothetical protein
LLFYNRQKPVIYECIIDELRKCFQARFSNYDQPLSFLSIKSYSLLGIRYLWKISHSSKKTAYVYYKFILWIFVFPFFSYLCFKSDTHTHYCVVCITISWNFILATRSDYTEILLHFLSRKRIFDFVYVPIFFLICCSFL